MAYTYAADGFEIVRGVFSASDIADLNAAVARIEAAAHATGHDPRVRFRFAPGPGGEAHLSLVDWPCLADPVFERIRTDRRVADVLSPLVGSSLDTIRNALFLKRPGGYRNAIGYHQDAQYRDPSQHRNLQSAAVQFGIAIDPQSSSNGGLRMFPGSHLGGIEKTSKPVLGADLDDDLLNRLGLRESDGVDVDLAAGDAIIWTQFTVHGSTSNRSDKTRSFHTIGYMDTRYCEGGLPAFR